MENRAMDEVYGGIVECLNKGKKIYEEHFYAFLESMIEGENISRKTEKQKRMRKQLQKQSLFAKLNEIWQYELFHDMSKEQVFLCGAMWGSMQMEKEKKDKEEEEQVIASLVEKYAANYKILKTLRKRPGIRHKDLADIMGKTPSGFSQYVSKVLAEGLIVYSYIGREKHYYLSELGKKVYRKIGEKEKKSRPQISSDINYMGYVIPKTSIFFDGKSIDENKVLSIINGNSERDVFPVIFTSSFFQKTRKSLQESISNGLNCGNSRKLSKRKDIWEIGSNGLNNDNILENLELMINRPK